MTNIQAYGIGSCTHTFYFLVGKSMTFDPNIIPMYRRKAFMLYYDLFIDPVPQISAPQNYKEYLLWTYELS